MPEVGCLLGDLAAANAVTEMINALPEKEEITTADEAAIEKAREAYNSLTDDQTKLGRPTGFNITIRSVTVSAGAGFIVVLTGDIMTMPGLPRVPAAEKIDVDENGVISGLF